MDLKEFYSQNIKESEYHHRFLDSVKKVNYTYGTGYQVCLPMNLDLYTQYVTKRYSMDFRLSTEHDFGGEHAILIRERTCTTVFFCNMVD